jgi:hypothetical protein
MVGELRKQQLPRTVSNGVVEPERHEPPCLGLSGRHLKHGLNLWEHRLCRAAVLLF